MALLQFLATSLDLAVDIVPLPLALGLALLIRNRGDAVLAVANLALAMELLAVGVQPDYRFGSDLLARLLATALQLLAAHWALHRWRQRQRRLRSMVAH